ncbi:L,D-transpeptidase family protein [Rhodoflexus sp.]
MKNYIRVIFCCCVLLWVSRPVRAQQIPETCLQLVVVQADGWSAVPATLQRYERADSRSAWKKVGKPFQVVLGKNGMAWDSSQPFRPQDGSAPIKREGDGKAPAGLFPLLYAYGYDQAQSQWRFPYLQVNESTLCIDDPQSRYYNQVINRDSIAQPDWKSYEDMRRKDELYRLGIVVGYNTQPVHAGNGSCIFMHLSGGTPRQSKGTAGCTAMLRSEILQILDWLHQEKKPMLLQMPVAELKALQHRFRLP